MQIELPGTRSFPLCLGYREWIEEVWINYISNAIKYGGETLANGFARYWIQDNGEGIQSELQDNLFIPFHRLPQSSNHSGHGLGLSIVLQIIEKHGGVVAVESTPGNGSIFSFTLPNESSEVSQT